jgi:anhydro-N-acetylmuramic acid kinase
MLAIGLMSGTSQDGVDVALLDTDGARNPTLMRMLAERPAPARVETAHAVGWSIDSLEAQAFAYLAVRSLRGLPLTFPGTTGAPRPLKGGALAKP